MIDVLCSGAWIIFPTYMCYVLAMEIVQGLEASGGVAAGDKKRR